MAVNTMNIIKQVFFTLTLCTVIYVRAFANDTSIGDENGTIVFKSQPDISMDKESLVISESTITVDYEFRNTSTQDLMIPVAFPMPPMYFGFSDHSEIKDFKLWADGKPIKTKRQLVILLNNQTDITNEVAGLGWSESELITYIDNRYELNNQPPKGNKPLPAAWFDQRGEPLFTLNEYFIWQQMFGAGKTVKIKHTYSPSLTTGVPMPATNLIKDYAKATCLDKSTQHNMFKREKEYGLRWANVRYILLTGNNWQGAIKDFNLSIEKQYPEEMVSLCFDGELKKVSPTTFSFNQKNFKPKQNLNILFLSGPDALP